MEMMVSRRDDGFCTLLQPERSRCCSLHRKEMISMLSALKNSWGVELN